MSDMATQRKSCPDLAGAQWRGSDEPHPDGGRLEVAFVDGVVCMRSSAEPDGPVLVFTSAEWSAFVEGAADGEFDLSANR